MLPLRLFFGGWGEKESDIKSAKNDVLSFIRGVGKVTRKFRDLRMEESNPSNIWTNEKPAILVESLAKKKKKSKMAPSLPTVSPQKHGVGSALSPPGSLWIDLILVTFSQ